MAKLKAPLLSLGATGQLAKTLVFFPWKGINAVREYVIPANPNTTLQQTQRSYVTDGVAMVHTALARDVEPLDENDQTAYSALATAKGLIMTWFNQAIKLWIDVKVDAKIPIVYSNGHMLQTSKDDFRMVVIINEEESGELEAGKFYLGTTRTNLIQSKDASISSGANASLTDGNGFTGLTAGVKYFWQFRPAVDDDCEGADSGIYYGYAT